MTSEDIKRVFSDDDDNEHLKFERVQNKRSERRDLHAFIVLSELLPSSLPIISGAEYDQIWIEADPEDLAQKATEQQLIDLRRAGLCYDSGVESFYMFV